MPRGRSEDKRRFRGTGISFPAHRAPVSLSLRFTEEFQLSFDNDAGTTKFARIQRRKEQLGSKVEEMRSLNESLYELLVDDLLKLREIYRFFQNIFRVSK